MTCRSPWSGSSAGIFRTSPRMLGSLPSQGEILHGKMLKFQQCDFNHSPFFSRAPFAENFAWSKMLYYFAFSNSRLFIGGKTHVFFQNIWVHPHRKILFQSLFPYTLGASFCTKKNIPIFQQNENIPIFQQGTSIFKGAVAQFTILFMAIP